MPFNIEELIKESLNISEEETVKKDPPVEKKAAAQTPDDPIQLADCLEKLAEEDTAESYICKLAVLSDLVREAIIKLERENANKTRS